jgi:glucose-1-phosphate thymidylyltransferase
MTKGDMYKAVILARGLGTRMRKEDQAAKLTGAQEQMAQMGVKAMIPVDGHRPFMDYTLSALADAGYTEVALIIGPEHALVRDYYGKLPTKRIKITFGVQEKPLGTGDAVAAAETFAAGEPFLVINSDNYYPVDSMAALRPITTSGLSVYERDAMMAGSNIPADRVAKFAVVKVTSDGFLERIIEKPDPATLDAMPRPLCLSMNCWRFAPSIFKACKAIKPSPRGELEITDAVQYSIDQLGEQFRVLAFRAPVLDLSCRGDIEAVAQKAKALKVNL